MVPVKLVPSLVREILGQMRQSEPPSVVETATAQPPEGLVATMREVMTVYSPREIVMAMGKVRDEA